MHCVAADDDTYVSSYGSADRHTGPGSDLDRNAYRHRDGHLNRHADTHTHGYRDGHGYVHSDAHPHPDHHCDAHAVADADAHPATASDLNAYADTGQANGHSGPRITGPVGAGDGGRWGHGRHQSDL